MTFVTLHPPSQIQEVHVNLPNSKSISNRVLCLQAYSQKKFRISQLSAADDTVLLKNLLIQIESPIPETGPVLINCENAGTVIRFLTGYLANKPGEWILTGSERMRNRPIQILVSALTQLGAHIEFSEKPGYPPLVIYGKRLRGGKVIIDASVSSQYISSLLMLAPNLEQGICLQFMNAIVSEPYIKMTLGLLNHYGITFEKTKNQIQIKKQEINPKPLTIEADWSSAAFWYSLASLYKCSRIHLNGLKKTSIQGDSKLVDIFKELGVESRFETEGVQLYKIPKQVNKFEYNFSDCPDLAQAVAISCAGLGIQAHLKGLKNLRIKETDRLLALENELKKLGYSCSIDAEDNFIIDKKPIVQLTMLLPIKTYNDHRMAMAFACLAPIHPGIIIENPDVVSKSYPNFWNDLDTAGFILSNK